MILCDHVILIQYERLMVIQKHHQTPKHKQTPDHFTNANVQIFLYCTKRAEPKEIKDIPMCIPYLCTFLKDKIIRLFSSKVSKHFMQQQSQKNKSSLDQI